MKKLILIGFILFELLEFLLFGFYIYFKGIGAVTGEFITDLLFVINNLKGIF